MTKKFLKNYLNLNRFQHRLKGLTLYLFQNKKITQYFQTPSKSQPSAEPIKEPSNEPQIEDEKYQHMLDDDDEDAVFLEWDY